MKYLTGKKAADLLVSLSDLLQASDLSWRAQAALSPVTLKTRELHEIFILEI